MLSPEVKRVLEITRDNAFEANGDIKKNDALGAILVNKQVAAITIALLQIDEAFDKLLGINKGD